MHGFWVLFRTLVRHYFSLSVLRDRLRRRQELWKPALSVVGIGVIGAPLLYGYVKLLQGIYNMSAQLAQPGMIVVFGLLATQLVVLMFGLFYLMSVFYYSSDLEYLVPMPLHPETILAAKFGLVLLTEYVTALPIAVPPIVLYGMRQGLGFTYWLTASIITLLAPLLPLALAAIIAVILMRTTNLLRHRDAMRVFAGLLSVAAALALQWKLGQYGAQNADPNQLLADLVAAPNSLVQILGNRFPPSLWGAQALIHSGASALKYMLAYLGSTLVSLGLLWAVARRYFFTGLLSGSIQVRSGRRRRHDIVLALAARSPLIALISREFTLLVRTPIFAMTAGLNLFLPPLILILPVLGAGEQLIDMQMALASPRFHLWGVMGIAGLFAALAPLASIAPTAISREGRLFWISQTIPVSPTIQLMAKLIFSVIAASASGALILMVAWFMFRLPGAIFFPGILLGLLALVVTSALSLAIDVFWPRLEWENPQQAMKGNQNVLIAMVLVVGLGYLLIRVLLWLVNHGLSDAIVMVAMAGVLVVLAILSIWLLFRLGTTLYLPHAARVGISNRRAIGEILRQRGRTVMLSLVIAGFVIFGGREFISTRNLSYTFGPDAVQFGSVELPYQDITEVRYLEQIPPLSNRVGTSIGNLKIGTFTVRGIGRGKVYATDSSKPALFLRTEKTFYIITPDNAKERYSEVQQAMQ